MPAQRKPHTLGNSPLRGAISPLYFPSLCPQALPTVTQVMITPNLMTLNLHVLT